MTGIDAFSSCCWLTLQWRRGAGNCVQAPVWVVRPSFVLSSASRHRGRTQGACMSCCFAKQRLRFGHAWIILSTEFICRLPTVPAISPMPAEEKAAAEDNQSHWRCAYQPCQHSRALRPKRMERIIENESCLVFFLCIFDQFLWTQNERARLHTILLAHHTASRPVWLVLSKYHPPLSQPLHRGRP